MTKQVPRAPDDDAALIARAAIRALPGDPSEGLFPADCWLRRISGEPIQILGGGRALLLEIAHPLVAAGVAQHSDFRSDPLGRLRRTLSAIGAIAFRDRSAVVAAVRSIDRAHARVHGTLPRSVGRYAAGAAYSARDPEAMRWVWATLVDTALRMYRTFVREPSAAAVAAYYDDYCAIARLLGVPAATLPATWDGFAEYFAEMLAGDALAVDATARQIAAAVLDPPAGRADARAARAITLALLPVRLRDAYGLRWDERKQARFEALVESVRGLRGGEDGG